MYQPVPLEKRSTLPHVMFLSRKQECNGFDVYKRPEKRIDYIFVSKNKITVKKYGVLANVKDQKYPSDHFPVFIIAEMR